MRIGVVADIHDAVPLLNRALRRFDEMDVETVVSLGDAFETFRPGEPGAEVAQMLSDVGAVGVWGNHDIGLSYNVPAEIRAEADPHLLDLAATLEPQIVLGDCRFSHVEPEIEATDYALLWGFDVVAASKESSQRSLDACPEHFLFMGHYHEWLITDSHGMVPFEPTAPIHLETGERYRIMVNAVIRGFAAVFDTQTRVLEPLRLDV